MKVSIATLIKENSSGAIVDFVSSVGAGCAQFVGQVPECGQTYEVEVDIDDDLHWGRGIRPSMLTASAIWHEDDIMRVTAELLCVEDGCAVLALADSIIMVTAAAIDPLPSYVDLYVRNLSLYPVMI